VLDPGFIDNMVKALFLAVQQDAGVKYIMPPPSYEIEERGLQRLRSPSRVLEERSGTCFDLSVLFASCLEHVGLDAVIFLVRGHAFFGYHVVGDWHTRKRPGRVRGMDEETARRLAEIYGPYMEKSVVADSALIEPLLRGRVLVPVNSTDFTEHGTYAQSKATGMEYLLGEDSTRVPFACAVDICEARRQEFLPIPPGG
jgi:hypothetical protein